MEQVTNSINYGECKRHHRNNPGMLITTILGELEDHETTCDYCSEDLVKFMKRHGLATGAISTQECFKLLEVLRAM